jgi:sensor histidine kinase YesM
MKQKIVGRVLLISMVTFLLSLVLSYYIFVPSLKKKAITNAEQTNAEILQQIDTLNSFVKDYTENLVLAVEKNPEILNYFSEPTERNRQIASLNLNNLTSNEGVARCVIISNDIVPELDSLNKITEADYAVLQSAWYEKLHKAEFGRGFSSVYQVELNRTTYDTAAYMKNFYYKNRRFTYVVFYNLKNLIYDVTVTAGKALDYCALVDTGNNAFYTVGDDEWEELTLEDSSQPQRNGYQYVKEGIRFTKTSVDSKWRVVSFVSNASIFNSFAGYMIGVTLVLLLFLVLLLIFLFHTLNGIINPITNLSQSMQEIAQGNLDCQVIIDSDDEIGRLGHSFNKMTHDLKHSLEVIAEKERKENQAKFSLLVSQIDPHFIYNTINSINYLARKKRCDAVIDVNSALIYILKDRLRVNDIQIEDTIANEMKVINQYIVIQKYMYEGDLQLHWQVDEELLTEQIPKNMIQPLVENALFHGLIDEESGEVSGTIEIRVERVEGDIVVKVKDNGQGMDAEKLRQVQTEAYSPEDRGKKVGLSNIRGRLYYLYGNSNCLKIESQSHQGTCITLTFQKEFLKKY